jgi:hypothetical protein
MFHYDNLCHRSAWSPERDKVRYLKQISNVKKNPAIRAGYP